MTRGDLLRMTSADMVTLLGALLACLTAVHGQRTGAVRLVGGADDSSGRLEIFAEYEWGTVTDDYFNGQAAVVVCRQLDFTDLAASEVHMYGYFGSGTGAIHLDEVVCIGTENNLLECSHRGLGNTGSDYHWEDVGISCYCAQNPECAIPEEQCPYFRTEILSVPHRRCPICRCASCPQQPRCPTRCESGQTMYYQGEHCRRCKCRPKIVPDLIVEPNDISMPMLLAVIVVMVVIPFIALLVTCIIKRKRDKAQEAKAKAAKAKEKEQAQAQPDNWFADPPEGQVMF
ncbi:uncharacterized protein LOC143278104 [Babylonia areolata]|uniref:uncharacterized protein LOC143278104 n=1 Tax=Babylonia areolata TaxID=304850 RepID=UPI003FD5705B